MTVEKIVIEKNTVQETLIIPLYGRKMCSEKFPDLYRDKFAQTLCQRLDYDFSQLEKKRNSLRYPGGCLVFDSVGKLGLKLMMSKILKNMAMPHVSGLFYVNNPQKELNWSDRIKVTSKAYMLGYYNMKTPGIHFLHRLLAKLVDQGLQLSINRMDFD